MRQKSKGGDEQCLRCGNHQHKTRGECPALGKKCDFCKKTGHFAKVCFKKLVNSIEEKPHQSDTDRTDCDEQVAKVAERNQGLHPEPAYVTSNTNVEYGQATTDDQIFKVGPRPALIKAKIDGHEVTWQPDTVPQEILWTSNTYGNTKKKWGGKKPCPHHQSNCLRMAAVEILT